MEEPQAEEPEPAPEPQPEPEPQPNPEGVDPEGAEPEGVDPEGPEPEGLEPESPGSEDDATGEPDAQEDQPAPGEQAPEEEDTPQPAIQPGPRTATIEIIGDSAYYCSAGVIGDPRTVEGRRPTTYEVDVATGGTALETVMAACQKISPGGTLGVNILYDDEVVAQGETENRLGTVAVSWSPLEGSR